MGRKKFGLTGTSYNFKFVIVPQSGSPVTLHFTGGYHGQLDEYEMGIATRHKFTEGGKEKLLHYVEKEWVLDYSGLLPTEEGMLLDQIKNAEFERAQIYIQPHDDVDISYRVLIIEDKRKLSHYQNKYSTSRGYMIAFENADSIKKYQWSDTSLKKYHTADEMDFV